MILAGHETTATALFWSLYLLALDPVTQNEVAAEASAVAADGAPDIERLKFTRAVIDETMRLYPPAFLIARAAHGADTVAGLPVRTARRHPDRAVAVAPARKALARSERLRSVTLHAARAAARPLRLSAVRRRRAGLHRCAFRAGGGDTGAGQADPRLPHRIA